MTSNAAGRLQDNGRWYSHRQAGVDAFQALGMKMKPFSLQRTFLMAIILSLCSCASPHPYKGSSTYLKEGQLFCSLHHQRLIRAHGYQQTKGTCILWGDKYIDWCETYPNAKEFPDTKSELFSEPVTYDYCQACRLSLAERIK